MHLGRLVQWRGESWRACPELGAGKRPLASSTGIVLENYPCIMQPGFSMFQGILKHEFTSVFIG